MKSSRIEKQNLAILDSAKRVSAKWEDTEWSD